ncbi:MAG: Asp23/Gls24 family envelope stress response protein [Deltaproteobacteria bacterium]
MAEQVKENAGSIKIANEVVAIIAGLAASEVNGVAGMSGGIAGDIVEILKGKNLSKGVKVEVGEKETAIDLFIIVEYGVRIPDIAWEIQNKVKKAVESMTGLIAVEVNIHVQAVNFEKEIKKEPKEPKEAKETKEQKEKNEEKPKLK